MRTIIMTMAMSGLPLAVPPVLAADAQSPVPAAANAAGDSSISDNAHQLTEIIVTAQRKEESLQHAAVAVDVVQGAALAANGITNVGNISNLVPALSIEPSSTGILIFLRGVGNFTVVPTSDPAVAFNYDGVYIGRPTSTAGSFFDLARIEVLKGPQGTLYGRNATGGAINVIPQVPKLGELSGYATAGYGSYSDKTFEGAINVPVGENNAFRLSGDLVRRNGYFDDGTSDDKDYSLRAQWLSKVTDALTVRLAADFNDQTGTGEGVTYLGRYHYAGPVAGYLFVPSNLPLSEGVYTAAAQTFRETGATGPAGRAPEGLTPYPFRDNHFYGVNADISYEASFGTFTIIPAYRKSKLNYIADAAAFIAAEADTDDQYSVEARLVGNRIGLLDYTLGALYYNEKITDSSGVYLSALSSIYEDHLTTDSYAPFARLTAHVTDAVRIVGGIRYTHDHKTYSDVGTNGTIVCEINTPAGPSCPGAPLFPYFTNFSALPFPFPAAGQIPPVAPIGGGAIGIRAARSFNNELSNQRTTWRGAVEYDVAPQSLVYASVETGFRSGGFSSALGYETYQPEFITAYTLGSKNRFDDSRLEMNVETFYWNYTNQQVNHVGLDINGVTANITQNIGKSRIYGAEFEPKYLLTSTTLISGDFQYLDTIEKSFVYQTSTAAGPPLTGCVVTPGPKAPLLEVNCSGMPAYNSPHWTTNFAVQQTVPLADYQVVVGLDTQFKTSRYLAFDYLAQEKAPSVWRSNAQVSFGPSSDKWSVAGYIRDIEDHRTPTFMSLAPVTNFLVTSTTAPRTFGVQVSAKF